MALSKEEVLHIAKLARLELKDAEVEKFRTQLSGILAYVEKLQKVKTAGVESIAQITGLKNVFRTDEVEKLEDVDIKKMLKQAPAKKDNLIKTIGVFE
ncbi:MAG: Asp-tRNA(Asn)/Glu-tRNA(Gln) amidotransferase subunit GatC [bacterium]|nr:Asp-tRNA(Asn)/Glu-tRNA(Gln) amidotransferase subunit GatC [bacterium]